MKAFSYDDRWIRVMCDYSAGGLWGKSGGALWPQHIPVSKEIRERLVKWQEWFETCPPDGRPSDFDNGAFCEEGLSIARAIKGELPDWTVIYYDERLPIVKRGDCEYEITIP